jgi:methylated-DNA-[protein]-cysteine S-methyltransferase
MLKSAKSSAQFLSLESPIGWLLIEGDALGVSGLNFVEQDQGHSDEIDSSLRDCALQVQQYFEGRLQNFDVNINMKGTNFQKQVWTALQAIPFGATRSYLDVAMALNNPNSTRAVGAANGQNRISIILPCHRVIGSNGKLTGYAGGLWRKEWLLQHEQKHIYGEQKSLF